MAKKDMRKKGCPNENCERNKTKYLYPATDKFCSICGTPLLFVCKECFCKIKDDGPKHIICKNCEMEKNINSVKFKMGKIQKKAGKDLENVAKDLGEAMDKGVAVAKDKAPVVKAKVVQVAKNKKIQKIAKKTAKDALEALKDNASNENVKKAVEVVEKILD